MTAAIIDGKGFAAGLRARVAAAVADLGFTPGLAVVLVGEDPASAVYVRNKGRETVAAGMRSLTHRCAPSVTEADLLALIAELNADPSLHGHWLFATQRHHFPPPTR